MNNKCIINTTCGVPRADVNGDGNVNIKDVQVIIRCIIDPECSNPPA